MSTSKLPGWKLLGPALALALFAACGRGPKPTVRIDGSSTVFPITQVAAQSFQKREPVVVNVQKDPSVTVGITGTGGGFRRFCAGDIDIANASRPIQQGEAQACQDKQIEFIELPIAFDGLAVVVNPANSWANDITTQELARLWEPAAEGRVVRWSHVRASWPDEEIHLFGAGTDSGTYDYFAEAVAKEQKALRKDYTPSEDDDVLVDAIANDRLALGFFGYGYVYKNAERIKALGVDDGRDENGKGAVPVNPESVANGSYQPFSRPLFIYVNKRSLQRREVELFVSHYLGHAAEFVTRVGYVPLPPDTYPKLQRRVNDRRVGSVFTGTQGDVGLTVQQVLARER